MTYFGDASVSRMLRQEDLETRRLEEPILSMARAGPPPRLDPCRVVDPDEGPADRAGAAVPAKCWYQPLRADPAAGRAMHADAPETTIYLPYRVPLLPPYTATWRGKSGRSYDFGVTDAAYPLSVAPALAILVEHGADGKAVPLWVGANIWDAIDDAWHLEPEVLSMISAPRQRTRMHVRFEARWRHAQLAEVEDLIAALAPPFNAAIRLSPAPVIRDPAPLPVPISVPVPTAMPIAAPTPVLVPVPEGADAPPPEVLPATALPETVLPATALPETALPVIADAVPDRAMPASVEVPVLVAVVPAPASGDHGRRWPLLTTLHSKIGDWLGEAWRATAIGGTRAITARVRKARVKTEAEVVQRALEVREKPELVLPPPAPAPVEPEPDAAPLMAAPSPEAPASVPPDPVPVELVTSPPLDDIVASAADEPPSPSAPPPADPAPSPDVAVAGPVIADDSEPGDEPAPALPETREPPAHIEPPAHVEPRTTVAEAAVAEVPVPEALVAEAPIPIVPVPAAPRPLGLPDHGAMVLFAGEMSHNGGIDILVDATGVVAGDPTDATFVFVGDGPMKSEMEARAYGGGFAHRCRFPGHLDGKTFAAVLETADIVVVPARVPQDATLTRRAIDAGRWVLSTHQAQLAAIEHGRNGLVTYDNPGSLVWGIRELLGRVADRHH